MHGFDDTDVGVGPIFVYFARLIRHAANNIQIRTMNKTYMFALCYGCFCSEKRLQKHY